MLEKKLAPHVTPRPPRLRWSRKAKLIRRAAKPPQGCTDCDNRINHLLFGKKDYANLIETFWQLRSQLAEILGELAAKVAREHVICAGKP